MNKLYTVLFLALFFLPLASAASIDPRHPLSQIHPIDEGLNMSGYPVFNASSYELQDGLNFSGYSIYDQGNVRLLEYDTANSKWIIPNSDLDLDGNSISNFFGSRCPEDYAVDRVYANGSYSCTPVLQDQDDIEDIWVNETGDTMSGPLDMAGNDINNPGNVDGVDLDNPGAGITIDGSNSYAVGANAVGNTELANSERFNVSGLNTTSYINMSGNRITNVPAPDNPGDAVNKSYVDVNDDTIPDDQDLQDVLSQGSSAENYSIDLSSQDIYSVRRLRFADRNSDATFYNVTESGGDLQIQKDGNQRLNILKTGGIAVKNGNLELSDNQIDNVASLDGGGDAVTLNDNLNFNGNNLTTGGSPIILEDSTGNQEILVAEEGGNVEIPNGQLDMRNNSIINIPAPVNNGSVVNKSYVDSEIEANTDAQDLQDVLSQDNRAGSYNIDLDGNDLEDSGTIIWDSSNAYIPQERLENDSLTVSAGNQLTGGGSVSLGSSITLEVDESGLNADQLDGMEASEFENETHASEHAGNFLDNPSGDTLDVQAGNMDWTDLAIQQQDVNVSDLGEADAELNMSSNKITNLQDPDNPQDAATKSYVDTSDDTIADDQDLSDVLARGNTANQSIDMDGHRVQNVVSSSPGDAVNRSWVENNDDTIADNQTLSVNNDTSGTDDQITIENGNTVTIDDDYEADTTIPDDQNLSEVLAQGNVANQSINMDGNQLQDASKVGVGTASPSEDLDVDGTASISNSGTSMDVDSNGNVVVTLGS